MINYTFLCDIIIPFLLFHESFSSFIWTCWIPYSFHKHNLSVKHVSNFFHNLPFIPHWGRFNDVVNDSLHADNWFEKHSVMSYLWKTQMDIVFVVVLLENYTKQNENKKKLPITHKEWRVQKVIQYKFNFFSNYRNYTTQMKNYATRILDIFQFRWKLCHINCISYLKFF